MLQSRFNYNYSLKKDFSTESASACLRQKEKVLENNPEKIVIFFYGGRVATIYFSHQPQLPCLWLFPSKVRGQGFAEGARSHTPASVLLIVLTPPSNQDLAWAVRGTARFPTCLPTTNTSATISSWDVKSEKKTSEWWIPFPEEPPSPHFIGSKPGPQGLMPC